MLRSFLVLSLIALLAGCSGLTPRESLQGQGDADLWQSHKQHISQIDGWQINGKIGIRAPSDSGSATLFWLQRQDYYDIRLSGPLGGGAARLTGRPGDILLEVANRGRFRAESPEALLQEQLRLELPVSNLLWWIRGLPAPDSRSRISLDSDSRLARLEQDGWQVDYLRYTEQNGHTLPERLKLKGADLEITLVLKDWQPRQLGQ